MSNSMKLFSAISFTAIASVCLAQVADPVPVFVSCPGKFVTPGLSMQQYWVPAFTCPAGSTCVYTVATHPDGTYSGVGLCHIPE